MGTRGRRASAEALASDRRLDTWMYSLTRTAAPVVLVVDDDEAILRSVRWMVSAIGYAVVTTRLPEMALALLVANPRIRAVIADARMSDARGAELVQTIRARGLATPVLLMADERGQADGLPVLLWPFTRSELARRLDELGVGLASLLD